MTEDLSQEPTTLEDLQTAIRGTLDRDGKHDWDETARLAEIIAAKVWNELHQFPFADSLDAAWAEAEAALPEHSMLELMYATDAPGRYVVGLKDPDQHRYFSLTAGADTPAAALRALAAKLRA